MVTKTITYKDYNGVQRTEDFLFNLNKSEILEMESLVPGGMSAMLETISKKKDIPALMKSFKTILLKAYGEKSEDGRRFMKSDEISKAFEETPAYDDIFMELVTDGEVAANFIREIMPEDMRQAIKQEDLTVISNT